jgi:putative hydrolase of the HAD superfamily
MPTRSQKEARERWLLIDYGEVISTPLPSNAIASFARVAALDEKVFLERYWRFRRAYDLGESPLQYWSDVLGRDLNACADLVHELDFLDTSSWASVNNETLTVLAHVFDGAKIKIGLLSNAPESVATRIESLPWTNFLERSFFSCRLKMVKPDVRVFQHVLQELNVPASSVLFIDDRPENVAAALSQGINAQLFTTAKDLDFHLHSWL